MAGSVEIKVDTREFSRAIQEYLKHTDRDKAEVINQKGFSIAMAASKMTYKADQAKIETALGAIGSKLKLITRGKNKGTYRKAGLVINKASLAERIVRARIYKKKGRNANEKGQDLNQPFTSEGPELAAKFIRQKVASIAYIRTGWLHAVAALGAAIGKRVRKNTKKTMKRLVPVIGDAMPAKPGMNPTCSFWNAAFSTISRNYDLAIKHAENGLQAAISQEIGRMADHTAQTLQKTANKFSVRH